MSDFFFFINSESCLLNVRRWKENCNQTFSRETRKQETTKNTQGSRENKNIINLGAAGSEACEQDLSESE